MSENDSFAAKRDILKVWNDDQYMYVPSMLLPAAGEYVDVSGNLRRICQDELDFEVSFVICFNNIYVKQQQQ